MTFETYIKQFILHKKQNRYEFTTEELKEMWQAAQGKVSDALRKIGAGHHLDTCQWMLSEDYPCNCHVSIACAAFRTMCDDTEAETCND